MAEPDTWRFSSHARLSLRACLVVSLAGHDAQAQGPSPPRDALRMASVYQDIGSLDPHFAVGSQDRIPSSWIYSATVSFKPGSISPAEIEPDLAGRWESSAGNSAW